MMHGMEERLKNDLKAMCAQSSNKKIRKYAEKIRIRKGSDVQSWMGASIWATKMAADDDWFTREQWKEHGSLISSKIENANVFFYDDYSPKEVNLKEIQDYNQQYRKRTVSVYSPTSMLRRPPMVPAMSRVDTPWLFPMAGSSTSSTSPTEVSSAWKLALE